MMASSLIEIGPKLDWTRDHQMYDRYKRWKRSVLMVMDSALDEETNKAKYNYLKFWLGEDLPLIQKWEDTGKQKYDGDNSSGHILQSYWDLLQEEFKNKAKKLISIIGLLSSHNKEVLHSMNGSLKCTIW